jgi:hypothetical protein
MPGFLGRGGVLRSKGGWLYQSPIYIHIHIILYILYSVWNCDIALLYTAPIPLTI